MQVILIEDVRNLGSIGELVKVKPGYARNFLLPRKLAIAASVKQVKHLEHQKRLAAHRLKQARATDEQKARAVRDTPVTISRKVGDNNRLFGSVTGIDIEHALADKGINVEKRMIELQEPIKQLGEYTLTVRLRADLKTEVKVTVVGE